MLKSIAVVLSTVFVFSYGAHAASEGQSLDATKCDDAWTAISPNGDTLSQEKAGRYIINVAEIDSNGDGEVSQTEFNEGCATGSMKVAIDFPPW